MQLPVKNSGTADKIVLAAGQLFARQGYHASSTREISRLSGVSENTLFRHFDCKEDLFWSALLWHMQSFRFRRDLQEGMARCDPPEMVLPKIFELLADTAEYRPESLRLIAVAFLELRGKADAFCQEHLAPMLSSITQYLELSMKKGNIRELDPVMLTTAFMMSAVMYPALSALLGRDKLPHEESREAARTYTRFWLELLALRPLNSRSGY